MSGPLWRDSAPGWTRHRMAVTTLSTGQDLSLQLSVLRGVERGPTLGIMSGVHGDETMSLLLLRRLMDSLDGGLLRGVLVLLPVANPLALGAFSRFTPEQHGNVDLHTAFPG
ncbi:MAG TPA: succinylglutamate desuccinylase/aspartoacylase family protein, partial [Candidatus Nitrosotalea sp.]|nr:succinylglutamate desuccinylase/aspartoacylase family protein [Candidatus Nitrosotalea sp.]